MDVEEISHTVFQIISRYLLGENEETHEEFKSGIVGGQITEEISTDSILH
jgi:hypothetical protein